MNLQKLSEKFYPQLSLQIEETLSIQNTLEQLRSSLPLVQIALATLKKEPSKTGFKGHEEKICFLKRESHGFIPC